MYSVHDLNRKLGPLRAGSSGYHTFGACLKKASIAMEGASPLAAGNELSRVSVSAGPPSGLGLPCLLESSTALAMLQGPTLCCWKVHTMQGMQCVVHTAPRPAQLRVPCCTPSTELQMLKGVMAAMVWPW